MRKLHLLNSYDNVACQGRNGMQLRGEFLATPSVEEFKNASKEIQCVKCLKSNYFSYLLRQEAKKVKEQEIEVMEDNLDAWEAEDPEETFKRDMIHFALRNN